MNAAQRELMLIQAIRDIAGCAATTALDANLRIAWIDYQAQETLAVLDGDYISAALSQRNKDKTGELMAAALCAQLTASRG